MEDEDPEAPPPEDEDLEGVPQFPTLDAFVEELIAPVYERPTAGSQTTAWCPQWWRHDGAVMRLTALWTAWESMHASGDPEATARWLVTYADPVMAVVLDPGSGPFRGCSPEGGHRGRRPHPGGLLPCDPAPEGLLEWD